MFNKTKRIMFTGFSLVPAVMYLIVGITCLFRGGSPIVLTSWMGILLIVAGAAALVSFFIIRKSPFSDRAFLVKALTPLIVGAFAMGRTMLRPALLQIMISVMVLLSGLSTVSIALFLRHKNVKGRMLLHPLGVLQVLIGCLGFLNEDVLHLGIYAIIGISLIFEALVQVYLWTVIDRHIAIAKPKPVNPDAGTKDRERSRSGKTEPVAEKPAEKAPEAVTAEKDSETAAEPAVAEAAEKAEVPESPIQMQFGTADEAAAGTAPRMSFNTDEGGTTDDAAHDRSVREIVDSLPKMPPHEH